MGVAGVRRKGTDTPVTLNDKWHLGSDTKAMTATLIGKLVECGQLRWDTTMAEAFPELASGFDPQNRQITVVQLLTHQSGLPRDLAWWDYSHEGTVQQQRLKVIKQALSAPPEPGNNFEYSNLGYVIAGAVIEKVTAKAWEQEMQDEIFTPLHMDGAGFGTMAMTEEPDQPGAHNSSGKPVVFGPHDVPPVVGPAARVYCRLDDWAKFATDQLRGARGKDGLLKAHTYLILHTPTLDSATYAMGWIVAQPSWSDGPVLTHDGTNGMSYSSVWIAPDSDLAILVCTNQAGNTADKACNEAVHALVAIHDRRNPRPRAGSSASSVSRPATAP